MAWEDRMHPIERNDKSKLKQQLPTPHWTAEILALK